ncbi:MAG: hypothetical protein JST54_24145 [Deltaproteobacteria bacterium]|nr:hypothetical protein [Deltaproteobacteria bacterium]
MKTTVIVVAALMLAGNALAQTPAPTAPPPSAQPAPVPSMVEPQAAPAVAPTPAAPKLQLQEPKLGASTRYSRFSKGPGGPLLIFSGILTGIVTGVSLNEGLAGQHQDDFAFGVAGGVVIGGLASIYQYYAYTSVYGSMIDTLAALDGFLLGFAIDDMGGVDSQHTMLAPAILANALLVTSALIHWNADVDPDSALMVASGSIYGLWLSVLTTGLVNDLQTGVDARGVFMAPAIGLALGAALTQFVHIPASRMFKLDLIPIGVGLLLLATGAVTSGGDRPIVWGLALAGTAVAGVGTAILTAPDDPQPAAPVATQLPFKVTPSLAMVRDTQNKLQPGVGFSGAF